MNLASLELDLLVFLQSPLEGGTRVARGLRVGLSSPMMSNGLERRRRLLGDELLERDGTGLLIQPASMPFPGFRPAVPRLSEILRTPTQHFVEVVRSA